MTDTKASAKATLNLENALKSNKIDHVTYEHEKEQIENWVNSIYDNGNTCSRGIYFYLRLIALILALYFTNKTNYLIK
jgi:hypothetical protein